MPRLGAAGMVLMLFLAVGLGAATVGAGPAEDPAALVDTFIGTADGSSPDPPPGDKGGSTFPGAAFPFGMVQWSPDTAPNGEFSYYYPDDRIKGFSVNHISGPGCPALLDFPLLPLTEPVTDSPGPTLVGHAQAFRHQDEEAAPGYYRVTLASGIQVRLSATLRTGLAEITFPKGKPAGLLVQAGKTVDDSDDIRVTDGSLTVEGPTRVSLSLTSERFCANASRYSVHLALETDRPFASYATWLGEEIETGRAERQGPRSGAYLRFDTTKQRVVRVQVALSYVSRENAWKNLAAEATSWDLEKVRKQARHAWNERLSRIQVEGATDRERRMFVSALYRTLLHPNVITDVGGEYPGFDGSTHTASGYVHHANFSGWDVYRTWVQLAAIVAPDVTSDMVRSLVENGKACGGLPRWTLASDETGVMVGDPASAFIASAHAFGARGYDAAEALALMAKSASTPGLTCNAHEVRPGLALYLEKGYLPVDAESAGWGPTSTTLELAQSDFAIAQMAKALGESATHDTFLARSRSWRNLLDPTTLLIRPRRMDGTWADGFEPPQHEHYVEGNAVQYTFFVPHDFAGLVEALGGRDAVVRRLDSLFESLNAGQSYPHFYIGNEPQFSTPWLYNFAGEPAKTQEVVRRIVTRTFTDGPGGLPGNDDLGATSSWYVWATLGLYPGVPGMGGFSLASPLFPRVTIQLASGSRLEIRAPGAKADRPLVDRVRVNGEALTEPWLPWERISSGGLVEFDLAPARR
jgi:predicted alpha-1,2-mannosidase